MDYIFTMVSKALGEDFNELGWQEFHGSELEFHESRGKILDESGKPREKYIGQEGYALLLKIITKSYAKGFYECFISVE